MLRPLTAGLGVLTVLALAGTLTPQGQAMLGIRSPASDSSTSSSLKAIQDPGVQAPPASPAPAGVSQPAASHAPAAQGPAASQRPPAQAGPAQTGGQGGLGAIGNIANILLNLPQTLSQTQARPATDGDSRPPGYHPQGNPHRPRPNNGDEPDENANQH